MFCVALLVEIAVRQLMNDISMDIFGIQLSDVESTERIALIIIFFIATLEPVCTIATHVLFRQ